MSKRDLEEYLEKNGVNEKKIDFDRLDQRSLYKRKPLGAKNISKMGMVLGCIIVIIYNAFYLVNNRQIPKTDEQMSILMLGWGVASFFSPLIISVILDKFTKK
jgi:hypothetical protein